MRVLLFIIPVLFSISLHGQTRKQYLKAADNSFAQKNYYAALKYYEEVLLFDSVQTEIWYKYGEAAEKFYAFTLAEKAYQKVIEEDEEGQFPLVNYRMAEVKKMIGKYDEAIEYFQKVLKDTASMAPEVREHSKKELESCEWAMEVVSVPDENIEIEQYGNGVNTPYSEFAAEREGDAVYYTSLGYTHENDENDPPRHFNKVLMSRDQMPGEFWDNINSSTRHTAHSAFNSKGDRVYFTYCDYVSEAEIRCELYYRQKELSGEWGRPEKLPSPINLPEFSSSEPHVAVYEETGQEWLFFASDRPEGKGGMDIWYSVINEDGSLSDPVNLKSVNTEGNDITPFLHVPTQTLYFSNDSRQGLGGFDIFKSEMQDGTWGNPQHMGFPLNSSYDDIHFKLSPGKATALFSSNRLGSTFLEKEKEACCHDIYVMQTLGLEMLALTFDDWSKEPLAGVTITLEKITGKSEEPELQTNADGNEFHFTPKRREIYVIRAEKPGYHPYEDTIYLDRAPLLDEVAFTKEIYMVPSEVTLNTYTYDDYTKIGLTGTTLQLFELENGVPVLKSEITNETGNDFTNKLTIGRTYVIKATKQGYESDIDTIVVAGEDLPENMVLERSLYLKPLIFAQFLPITLYFDNDQPDRNTWLTTTKKEYLETWEDYYARKQEYLDEFGKGMSEQMQFLANQRIEDFFEREVKSSGEVFKAFSDLLYEFLKQGNNLEIALRGYTSPRAASDYNDNLSKRRISSVRNHFENYNDGIFKPFLKDGSLKIIERPYGETRAKSDVSDKLNDVRNSVYGVPASLERRVEIIDVKEADDIDAALESIGQSDLK